MNHLPAPLIHSGNDFDYESLSTDIIISSLYVGDKWNRPENVKIMIPKNKHIKWVKNSLQH
jgi:hypothetical protein